MQTEIHPEYVACQVHCSCGNEFTTRSTASTLRVELCSECHPFYTGKQKLVDTGGRVERFQRRMAKAQKKPAAPKSAQVCMAEPRYMGGQAVIEGVMMRGASTWAIAVRKPDGEIAVDVREVPGWSDRYAKVPILRGVMSLAESLGLGYRALTFSANQQVAEEDQISEKALGWAVIPVALLFSAVFIVIPAFAGKGLSHWFHGSFPIVEGVVRLALFVAYLLAVGCLKEIKRVFQYHGAEHKAIAAYENDVELTPQSAQQFSTAHVRCGTNFLLTVMVVAVFVYSVIPRPNLWFVIGSRIVLMPVIAGLSYEVIRLAARNMQRAWVRVLVRPGLLLQRLTTREPDLEQLEVAIASLRAVFTAEQRAEVATRVGRLVPAVAPAV